MSGQPTPRENHPDDAQANRDTLDAQREGNVEDPKTTVELTAAFHRVARDVRLTALLLQHLHDPVRAAQIRTAARTRILREVEDTIHRETEGRDAEHLRAELLERLDAPDLRDILDDDIRNRPTADIIADIRRDLGVAGMPGCNPWLRRTPADIAALNARAAKPSAASLPPGSGHKHHPGAPERLFRIIAAPNDA